MLTCVLLRMDACSDCGCDAVRVYDGPSTSSPLLGTVCGHDNKIFHSSSHTLTVVLSSNDSVTRAGFIARWSFTGALIISLFFRFSLDLYGLI